MISKSQVVNFLFVSSFAFYGVGKYIAKVANFSVGNVVSIIPLLCIIIFFLVDVILKKGFYFQLNKNYILVLLFVIFTFIFSFLEALQIGHPGFNNVNTAFLLLFIFAISHSTILVMFYNSGDTSFNLGRLIYIGMTIDIGVNLLAYAAGLQNVIHHIPGRLNLPFSQGFYATANSVAIINVLILGMWVFEDLKAPLKLFTIVHFIINLWLMTAFNSRLSIMIFLFCSILIIFRIVKFYRFLFFLSFFTIPLMLSFTVLIYNILQLPILSKVINRLDYNDITSFNGRRDLWERGIDWFLGYGPGFWTGNGYQGHYTIGLLDDLAEFWHRSSALGLHIHSSFFEYLLSQGVLGTLPLLILILIALRHLVTHRSYHTLLGVMIYLIFIFQIDIYAYITNTGAYLFFILISVVLVKDNSAFEISEEYETNKNKHYHALV